MFTGLVDRTGEAVEVMEAGEGKRIRLKAGEYLDEASEGDSISVSGVCLTLEKIESGEATIFLAEETLDRTWFSDLNEGDRLNMEKSLTPQDRMGGHYVQGHVDATSEILEVEELEEGWNIRFETPQQIEKYIVEKGFIAVEGISLTITEVDSESFSITIIPETWERTNLSDLKEGDSVNIEADVMAKYAEKAAETAS